MEHKKAANIAIAICQRLLPYTSRINIAGSIRRSKPEVKDIEILCLPGVINQLNSDLFSTREVKVIHPRFIEEVNTLGKPVKGQPSGRYMQIKMAMHDIILDLFMPTTDDYFRQYAIRTGSAEYAARTIAAGWKKMGWCGSDQGLRKQSDCIKIKDANGKSSWRCINPQGDKPPTWESEVDFFKWLGVPWIMPKLRTI